MSTASTQLAQESQALVRERRSYKRVLAALALIVLLVAIGVWPKLNRSRRAIAVAHAAETELPVVNVVRAQLAPATAELILPGNTEAVTVAHIYARASGYVSKRFVDIGSVVKAGQVLAVIESPELDQQVAQARASAEQARAALEQSRANLEQARAAVVQARANVQTAKANEEIAGTTNERWERLVSKGVLPKQSGDERRTAYAARVAETAAASAALGTAEANVRSQQANIKAAEAAVNAQLANASRYQRLQGFEQVVAPFSGVITERNVEQGDLVTADAGGNRNLFSIAQAQTLRIKIDVPQSYAVDVKPGQESQVLVRERPGKTFAGTVARTANALDNASRTMRVEVQVDNRDGALLPGMYAQVKFALGRSHPTVLIPAEALVANAQGTRVLKVGSDNKVRYASVGVGRDLGTQIEVLDGLSGNEALVTNPSDTLVDGDAVRTASAEGKKL